MKPSILILATALIYGCSGPQKLTGHDFPNDVPPGTVPVTENLYCDATEVSNFSYREYLYWTRRVFGESAYTKALPDTTVWRNSGCLHNYENCYLRSVRYKDHPVVGLTYEQALAFSRWRADRVMEFILVRENHISIHDVVADTANYFTIERYYSGKYKMKKRVPLLMYYPHYHLPSKVEWNKVLSRADSINEKASATLKRNNARSDTMINCLRPGRLPVCADDNKTEMLRAPLNKSAPGKKHKAIIRDMLGNLKEMSDEKGISFGGSWKDSLRLVLIKDTFHYSAPDDATGFRNVCEWKMWNGSR